MFPLISICWCRCLNGPYIILEKISPSPCSVELEYLHHENVDQALQY